MISYTPFQYLLIDIANHFGLDKLLFEDRILWAKSNLDCLESLADQADEKELFIKAVMALRDVQAGKPTGHIIRLDAICSGIQIMSAITGDVQGASITGLIDPDVRSDAYTEIHKEFNFLASKDGHTNLEITRAETKDAIMTAAYGSTQVPKMHYGNLIDYFDEACMNKAPGAFELMKVLIDSWNPDTLAHTWTMPDGHEVFIPVMDKFEKKAEIDEMDHYEMTVQYRDNVPLDFGLANAANVIHSIDAYILRCIVRMSNHYVDPTMWLNRIQAVLLERKSEPSSPMQNPWGLVDLTWLTNIGNFSNVSTADLLKYVNILTYMESHQKFPLATVHDAFGSHAHNCNHVRWYYKEMLAMLSESNIITVILQKLYNIDEEYTKYGDIADLIRNSNYALS